MRKRNVDALTIKSGPTGSGITAVHVTLVPPCWELLALDGIIASIASVPIIIALFSLFLQRLRSK